MDWFSLKWFTINQLRAFQWEYPYYLYAVLLVPIALWLRGVFHGNNNQKLTLSFGNQQVIRTWSSWLRWLFPLAMFGVLACVLLALARPQIVKNSSETDAEAIDIVLALDISESMQATDLSPTRLAAAKQIAQQFIGGRLQDRIGLVVFAGEAFTLCPLTNDYQLLEQFIKDINPNLIRTTGTSLGSALAISINRMRDSQARSKVTILLSDGDNTAGNLDPLVVSKLALAFGIKVYAIAVGVENSKQEAIDKIDANTLQKIATTTQGRFFRATDNDALQSVFKEIDRLEKVKIKQRTVKNFSDYYRVYLYWAIFFFLFALFLKAVFIANVLED